jgi:hypothetical protein
MCLLKKGGQPIVLLCTISLFNNIGVIFWKKGR